MKNLFFSVVAVTSLLAACNNNKQTTPNGEGGTAGTEGGSTTSQQLRRATPQAYEKDTISKAQAQEMIKYWKKVKKDYDTIYSEFPVALMQSIFCDTANTPAQVRFFFAGKDTTYNGKKYSVPVLVMQVKSKDKTLVESYTYYPSSRICPPPDNCTF